MKTGLVTCYINNYGACLQAYALSQKIKEISGSCKIVRYQPYYDLSRVEVDISKKNRKLFKVIRAICHPIRFQKRQIHFQKCKIRDIKFEEFRNKYLEFDTTFYKTYEELKKNPPKMNKFVCGSDQIWNPVIHKNRNILAYFLDFAPMDVSRIAYSPSIGCDRVPDECIEEMAFLINKFNYLSVREQKGAEIIKDISGIDVPVLIDPTFLYDGTWWYHLANPVKVEGDYIFCYMFNENQEVYDLLSDISRRYGYKIISLPFSFADIYSKSKKIYNAGPCEFLYLIKNAKVIVTDSFHCTAFSLNFNKDFYCVFRNKNGEKNNMNSRIETILGKLNLNSRIINNFNIDDFKISSIDYKKINPIIKKERKKGEEFLKEALL